MRKLGLFIVATSLSSPALATSDLSREEIVTGLKTRMDAYTQTLQGTDEAARLEAVRRFRYAPKVEGGKPVASHGVENLITFELES